VSGPALDGLLDASAVVAVPSNYSPELRARSVRMVTEPVPEYPSQYAGIIVYGTVHLQGADVVVPGGEPRPRAFEQEPQRLARELLGLKLTAVSPQAEADPPELVREGRSSRSS
jgi:hypothetical protein